MTLNEIFIILALLIELDSVKVFHCCHRFQRSTCNQRRKQAGEEFNDNAHDMKSFSNMFKT